MNINDAIRVASSVLRNIDRVNETENFFVCINNHVPEMTSSGNMVAVEKKTGSCCNFVSVIPVLGDPVASFDVSPEGNVKAIRGRS